MKKYVWQQKTRPNSSKLPETLHPPEIFGIFLVRRTTTSTYLLLFFFVFFFFGWRRLLDVSAKHCYQRIFAAAVTDGAELRCVGLFASGSLCRRGEKNSQRSFSAAEDDGGETQNLCLLVVKLSLIRQARLLEGLTDVFFFSIAFLSLTV